MAVILKKAPNAPKPAKRVMIAMPNYTGTVDMLTLRSLCADIADLAAHGIGCSLIDEIGNGLIGDVRAKFVARFLADKEFTHLMMIDDDVSWLQGSIRGLLAAEEEFICGLYPRRSDPLTFNFRADYDGKDGVLNVNDKGLIEGIWAVPAGFMLLSRAACEKMVAAYPHLIFESEKVQDVNGKYVGGYTAHALFDPYFLSQGEGRPPVKLGEDYAFCQRWKDIGGKIYVDPAVIMGHTGRKTFLGKLGDVFIADVTDEEQPSAPIEGKAA